MQAKSPSQRATQREKRTSSAVGRGSSPELDSNLEDSLLANVNNMIVMNTVNEKDANKLSTLFEEYKRNHFVNMERFEFVANIKNKYQENVTVEGKTFPEYRD